MGHSHPLLSAPLRRRLVGRRFAAPPFTALVFDSGYHLQRELAAAITQLGHRAVTVPISGRDGATTPAAAMRALLTALLAHRPDCVVSINHIGFDAEGLMGQVLEELEVPVAVWYVDAPLFIHEGFFLAAPAVSTVWSWESAYVPLLRRLGAGDAHHLPLATQPERFAQAPGAHPPGGPGPSAAAAADLLFVGSSLGARAGPWWRRLDAAEASRSDALAEDLCRGASLVAALGTPQPTPDRRMTVLAQACLRATARQRRDHLRALTPLGLCVAGDEGWRDALPGARRAPPIAYGAALARAYRQAHVNVNLTSLQMPTAVNQRLFDVPAAGGFVLTDRQADGLALFPKDALATFEGPEDLAEMARFFLGRAALRDKISARAREVIVSRHTYVHRAQTMLAHLQARWARA